MNNVNVTEKDRYQAYLTSREWGLLRQQVKARSGGICERCKINPSDAVHHLTYERKYNERLEDLQDICEACHQYEHGLSDEDPLEKIEEEPTRDFSAVLIGFFRTQEHIFVFFNDENPDVEDWNPECFFVARVNQEAEIFSAICGRKLSQGLMDSLGREWSPRSHLGRRYSIRVKPSQWPRVQSFLVMEKSIYDLDIAGTQRIDLLCNTQLFFVINAG